MQGYTYLLIIIQWKIKIQYLIAFKKQAIRIPIVLILQLTKEYKSNLLIASMGLIFTIQKITREFNTKNKIHFESNSDTHIEIKNESCNLLFYFCPLPNLLFYFILQNLALG
jgi:hypothetical protein